MLCTPAFKRYPENVLAFVEKPISLYGYSSRELYIVVPSTIAYVSTTFRVIHIPFHPSMLCGNDIRVFSRIALLLRPHTDSGLTGITASPLNISEYDLYGSIPAAPTGHGS